jgi:PPK2 family polyphosphate:nucleotide phosphotransferase
MAKPKFDDLIDSYRVTKGKGFRIRDFRPDDTGPFDGEPPENADELLREGVECLAKLQDKLYAQDRWAVLLIFQAMDAAGKDGTIKHVMSGVNPQGCRATAFKLPSREELDHDYLWRANRALPERGIIGIFNRSYYEEVLVVRVHPEFLERQSLPRKVIDKKVWEHRLEDIEAYERYLARNGIAIVKFFLHVSKKEQKQRFLERLSEPDKFWKFSETDLKEREHWDEYMQAYEDAIRATARKHAPWYVVPADNKWYMRLVVSAAIVDLLESLNLEYPQVDGPRIKEIAKWRRLLQRGQPRPRKQS